MRRTWLIPFGFLAAGAGVAAVYFYRENRELRAELAALRATSIAAPEPVAPREPTERAADGVEASQAAVAVAESAPPSSSAPAGPENAQNRPRQRRDDNDERRDRGREFFARALADPESRAGMLTRAKGEIDRRFGEYFVKLGLDETQIETLRTLLAERQLVRMESGMLERAAETDQERADAQTWRESKLATAEADINAVLGPDGLKNLQAYLDSAPQRRVVDDIARRASYAGAPLSTESSDQLVEVVGQVSTEHPLPRMPGSGRGGRDDDDDNGNNNASRRQPLNPDSANAYLSDLRARNQAIIERAREFLTQPQLEALADQQLDEIQQAEAQLNFMLRNPDARGAGMRFGGGPGDGRGPGG
jgi:hypothetical protein